MVKLGRKGEGMAPETLGKLLLVLFFLLVLLAVLAWYAFPKFKQVLVDIWGPRVSP